MAKQADRAKGTRTERVEVRVSPAVRRALERASSLTGRSLSDFIASSAYHEAQRTIAQHETLVLRLGDREAFVAALTEPPRPTLRARRAAKRYRRLTEK
jgi:uncharacterized protein (DUF1778 family)